MAITITNDAVSTRTNLGLGDAATKTTGTGAGNVPLNSNLSTVAASGAYADVSGTPTFKTVGGSSIIGSGDISTLPSGGTANQVVTKNSSNNPVWATPAAGGKVLQVVTFIDDRSVHWSTTNTSWHLIANHEASITPVSASSKIIILYNVFLHAQTGSTRGFFSMQRNGTSLANNTKNAFGEIGQGTDGADNTYGMQTLIGIDSPNTTSSVTYSMVVRKAVGSNQLYIHEGAYNTITLMEISS
jgi:hypothetical protein